MIYDILLMKNSYKHLSYYMPQVYGPTANNTPGATFIMMTFANKFFQKTFPHRISNQGRHYRNQNLEKH